MSGIFMKKKTVTNIGILGGTFDPVHTGHIEMAKAAYEQCMLDRLMFMPTGNPPHKTGITPVDKRLAMVELALSDHPEFEISDIELKREGIIYTADTIDIVKDQWPDSVIYYIIGADSLAYIDKWYQPERFLDKITLTVCNRTGYPLKDLNLQCAHIAETFKTHFMVLDFTCVDISSSDIRNDPGKYKDYIPEKVYDYIKKEGLYA